MLFFAAIPVLILAFTIYLSWSERDSSSWPDEEYEDFFEN